MEIKPFITLGRIMGAASGSGELLPHPYDQYARTLADAAEDAHNHNGWFTPNYVKMQLKSLSRMLDDNGLAAFYHKYSLGDVQPKDIKIRLIPAGNIPLVCLHDLVCILLSGCTCIIKYSSKDKLMPSAVVSILKQIAPELEGRIIEEKDGDKPAFDGIIATGSNNSSRYFDYYFAKYPHIIRRNRNSVAVITGDETTDDYLALADDIFAYYGLGCRSVSKIYVPKDYDYNTFFGNIVDCCEVAQNIKYSDNYTYNKAIYLMSGAQFLDNNFLLLKEDEGLGSPIGVLFAERYDNIDALAQKLRAMKEQLQCVVAKTQLPGIDTVGFGMSQYPQLLDYADGVDTMQFLLGLQSTNS